MGRYEVRVGSLEMGRGAHVDEYEAQGEEEAIQAALVDYPECEREWCEVVRVGDAGDVLWNDGAES